MRDLEFIALGLFVVGLMLCLCIDVFKRNRTMMLSYQNQSETENAVRVIEVFEGLEEPEELVPAAGLKEVVYPMYIDCSRNVPQPVQPPAC
ncbi:hypothetical protein ACFPES_34855 [Paenibacillus sp. GCM10023248]|uniref:hypothetical protein n=1 Tax=Bacillales TaxID=1385 RepID=UPI0023789A44|nr:MULTISPECIES: hypothetical protein [Bacillales]MDD9272211.1 hypothetical protein [Paenibacillus sp. MAHUQ-63]MDR6884557.1 hypothetical protein [Bacillus sp. 3255]